MVPHKQGCAVERENMYKKADRTTCTANRQVPRVTHKVQERARGSAEPGGQRTGGTREGGVAGQGLGHRRT